MIFFFETGTKQLLGLPLAALRAGTSKTPSRKRQNKK
jgi:hypothetical protein